MLTIVLPIYWQQTKNKNVLCSMNAYRNWHYHTSSKWKNEFHQLIIDQLPENYFDIFIEEFTLDIKFYYKNICDASNVIPLMEKVVLDTLQTESILHNDNVNYHLGTCWTVSGQDKSNPRVEIHVLPIKEI